jgi:peptidylprolyl isomerase
MKAIHAALAAAAVAACSNAPDQSGLPPGRRVATDYAAALKVDLAAMERRPTGLYVQDVAVGEGARADSGDIVVVHYTGWLPQGVKFDSSRDRDEPFEVAIGYRRVIQGWDQGIVGMREGGRRRLVIPPVMAYGERGSGRIPRNSTLVFDVELLSVVNRTPEGGEGGGGSG